MWWAQQDSNLRPKDYESSALPLRHGPDGSLLYTRERIGARALPQPLHRGIFFHFFGDRVIQVIIYIMVQSGGAEKGQFDPKMKHLKGVAFVGFGAGFS